MKKSSTELVFILDKSGSMAGLESDTIGGFNSMLRKQVDYVPDSAGTELNFQAISETVACFRATSAVPAAPLEAIRKDMKKRGWNK